MNEIHTDESKGFLKDESGILINMKVLIYIGIAIGGSIGGWLGAVLSGGDFLGGWSILGTTIGSFIGLWAGYKLGSQ